MNNNNKINYLLVRRETVNHGLTMHVNGIIIKGWDYMSHEPMLIYCENFPKYYKGKRPELTVAIYDEDTQMWYEGITLRDKNTEILFYAYVNSGRKRTVYSKTRMYSTLMKQTPHNTKYGHATYSCNFDPERRYAQEHATTDYTIERSKCAATGTMMYIHQNYL